MYIVDGLITSAQILHAYPERQQVQQYTDMMVDNGTTDNNFWLPLSKDENMRINEYKQPFNGYNAPIIFLDLSMVLYKDDTHNGPLSGFPQYIQNI